MADVFVSYSRSDKEFVNRLADDLKGRGKDVWIDIRGVRDAEVFPEALRRAIEGADAFLFVISPDSVASRYCELEVAHADALHKRIVPIALRAVDDDERLPEPIRLRSWIPAETDPTDRVIAALDADLEWERRHTRLTVRAVEWDEAQREPSLLLRGADLAAAEAWLSGSANRDPGPTVLEQAYILAGRQAAARRQRTLLAASVATTVVAVALLVFALISRGQAVTAETTANASRLAALSETQLAVDPERAVLLAMAGLRQRATYGPTGTMFALRAALDASTIRYRLPAAGEQNCGSPYPAFDPAPGSDLVFEGLCNGKIRFLNARNGRLERVVTVGRPGQEATLISYPGRRAILAGAVGDRLVTLNPTTGALLRHGPTIPQIGTLQSDPAAPLVAAAGRAASGHRGRFVIWNYRTGRVISIHPPLPMAYCTGFTFAPLGTLALSFSGDTGGPALALYDYLDRRVLATRTGQVTSVASSTDLRKLAVGFTAADGTGTIELVNARTLATERGFKALSDPQQNVGGLAFSLDDRLLAYGFQDGSAGVLNAITGEPVNTYAAATEWVIGVAISPDDRLAITASADGTARAEQIGDRALRTFPRVDPAQLWPTPGGFEAIAIPGPRPGQGVAVERYTDAGQAVGSPLVMSRQTQQLEVTLSPDGTLATDAPAQPGAASAPMTEWSVPRRRIVRTITFPNGPFSAPVISPDNQLLITGTGPPSGFNTPGPRRLVLLNLRTGHRRTLPGPAGCQWQQFAFSASGEAVAAGTFCGQVAIWDSATGRRLGAMVQIPGSVDSLAFGPDDRSLAIASSNGTVYVAPVPLTRTTRQLHGGTRTVQAVAYSPNGRYLASVALDSAARIYDARTLTELRVIQLPRSAQGVAFTTDSRDLLTWDASGAVALWDACTDCQSPGALVALARTRVTRSLTAAERQEFGVG
jgi:WD40 repeat protein